MICSTNGFFKKNIVPVRFLQDNFALTGNRTKRAWDRMDLHQLYTVRQRTLHKYCRGK